MTSQEQANKIVDKFKMETKDSDYTVIEGDDADQLILDIAQALDAARRETWEAAAMIVSAHGSKSSNHQDPYAPWMCSPFHKECEAIVKELRQQATAQADKEAR